MLQPRVIELIEQSFEPLRHNASRFTRVFYERLFEVDPTLKKLFIRDIREQRKKFFRKMDFIIKHLTDPEKLEPDLQELGSRHDYYKVSRDDYRTFFSAFLYALSAAMGKKFTPEVREAWYELCEYIACLMSPEINSEKGLMLLGKKEERAQIAEDKIKQEQKEAELA